MELAILRRYLQALESLSTVCPEYAAEMLRELSSPLNIIEETIKPIHEGNPTNLLPAEQVWRRLAERIKQ